jgi:hypothetical protein
MKDLKAIQQEHTTNNVTEQRLKTKHI